MSHFLGFVKQLKEQSKIKSDDVDEELLKYIELNKKELDYMLIKKFKDSVMHLKIILEWMEKMKIIERLEIAKIEEITKEELKELETKEYWWI